MVLAPLLSVRVGVTAARWIGLRYLAAIGLAAWAASAGLTAEPRAVGPLVIVEAGKSRAEIVVPDDAFKLVERPLAQLQGDSASVWLAAVELVDYVEKLTGVRLPMRRESATPAAGTRISIHLGATRVNQALVRDAPLDNEEFLIRTTSEGLHVIGGDHEVGGRRSQGTLYGLYTLLEDVWGVRFLFPGPWGEVVPKRDTLTVPPLDRREQPRIAKRKIRDVATGEEKVHAPTLTRWGIAVDAWKRALGPDTSGMWFRRQRLGGRIEIDAGHAYTGFYQKYGTAHPEFFARQPDGTRRQTSEREQLCVSNPALWDLVARLRIEEFRANPDKAVLSISPNDAGRNLQCMCDACRALDPPQAPKLIQDRSLIDPATRKPFPEYPSLSDRYFRFYNEVARRVGHELPDKRLGCYAYSVYRTPPVAIERLEPNLIVGYVGLDQKAIEAWSRIASQLFIRPNELGPPIELGLPRNQAAWLAASVKFAVEHHAIGFDFDSCHGNWGGHGLDYYVLAKALWNPDVDVSQVIADYCQAAYGPGAAAMQRYHARLEAITTAVRGDSRLKVRGSQATQLLEYYTPAALTELEADLAEARRAIQAADDKRGTRQPELARLSLADDSVHYARLVTGLLAAVKTSKSRKGDAVQQQLAAAEQFLKSKALTLSLASVHSYRHLQIALGDARPEEQ